MNYLVHLYLAGSDPLCRLGSLMGDFVKGPLSQGNDARLLTGLQLHRRIDSLAHQSFHTRSSRQRIDSRFGHVRGIMVDIFYDHFLARHWPDYATQPLEQYAQEIYATLAQQRSLLPPELQEIVPRMTRMNWLVSYRDPAAIDTALRRIATRLSRPTLLAEGAAELDRHRAGLEKDFRGFMEEASTCAEREFALDLTR